MDSLRAAYTDDGDDDVTPPSLTIESGGTIITTTTANIIGGDEDDHVPTQSPPSSTLDGGVTTTTTANIITANEDDHVRYQSPPPPTLDEGATTTTIAIITEVSAPDTKAEPSTENSVKDEPMVQLEENDILVSEENDILVSEENNNLVSSDENEVKNSPKFPTVTETTEEEEEEEEEDDDEEDEDEDEEDEEPPLKKQKSFSPLATSKTPSPNSKVQSEQHDVQHLNETQLDEVIMKTALPTVTPKSALKSSVKKSAKKKNNNVWTRPTSRKGKKKAKNNQSNGNNTNNNNNNNGKTNPQEEDRVLITPIPRFPDKSDDSPEMKICLSKFYKAEKVEIGEDRMSAGSTKGYRMVRATRGVVEGTWYFEIKIVHLGETGHTRLGWATGKGDLQAPVGFDANSFGYRDVDGSKVHKALREKYGEEGYREGDVLGFYISLPEGNLYAPNPPRYVWFKGQRYVCAPDPKEDPPKVIPGSEICFFKNGICQGTAFKDLYGGRYYPAASMYTLPNQPNCVVRFNFGPDFEYFPEDFNGRPTPKPMVELPYHGYDGKVENGSSTWAPSRLFPVPIVTQEETREAVETSAHMVINEA